MRIKKSLAYKRIISILLMTIIVIGFGGTSKKVTSVEKNFEIGSLIIPMDTTYQNQGMWKAYGLVYELMSKEIPVVWAIADAKNFNGIDFNSSAIDLKTNSVISSHDYTGGPFIIDSSYAVKAKQIIEAWWTKNADQPVVHSTTKVISANTNIILRNPPRIANEETNAGISITYYNAAGIPDLNGNPWTSESPNILDQEEIAAGALFEQGECSSRKFDIFVTPHNGGYDYSLTDPTNLGTKTYAQLDYFVDQGGGWLALCHSIISNEDAIANLYHNSSFAVQAMFNNTDEKGGFLTRNGFGDTAENVGGLWTVQEASLPVAQAVPNGLIQGLPGGSVQTWSRERLIQDYYRQTELVAHFKATNGAIYDWAINGVAHNGTTLGKVTFLGGHSYDTKLPYTANMEAPYLRFFYNSLFFNGSAVAKMDVTSSAEKIPLGYTSSTIITLENIGSSTANNLTETKLTLPQGVTYEKMVSGPAPVITTNDQGNSELGWPSLGDIPENTEKLKISLLITPTKLGEMKIGHFHAEYGDVYGEHFTADYCRSVEVYAPAVPKITKVSEKEIYYPGQIVNYTIKYWNEGKIDLKTVYVEDILPDGFTYKSSSVNPYSVILMGDGRTQVRWKIDSLPIQESGEPIGSIEISAYASSIVNTDYLNEVSLTGADIYGHEYTVAASDTVRVIEPPISLTKEVNPVGGIVLGEANTLTYTLRPRYYGSNLLVNALVADTIPAYTTYKQGSANLTGIYGYTPIPAIDAKDAESFADVSKSITLTLSVDKKLITLNGDVNAVMTIKNNSGLPLTNVQGVIEDQFGKSSTSAIPIISTIANGSSATINTTVKLTEIGERILKGSFTGTMNAESYNSPNALSSSILVVTTLNEIPENDIVTWRLGSNVEQIKGSHISSGVTRGLYAFYGGGKIPFMKYELGYGDVWNTKTNPNIAIKKGASLTTDGNGIIYASMGDSNSFYKYEVKTGVWTKLENSTSKFDEGGSIQHLSTASGSYIYAVLGNSNLFSRYNVSTKNWTSLNNVPGTVKKGGALTTDGTNLYALQGAGNTGFYKYDVANDAWSSLPVTPGNVGWGGSLTRVGDYLYAMQGGGKTGFWRYKWTTAGSMWEVLKPTPGNVGDGGALTTDGTYIYALQGKTKTAWRYNPSNNTWSTLKNTGFTENTGQGGAIVFEKGETPKGYFSEISVNASLLTTGDQVTVKLALRSTASTEDQIHPNLLATYQNTTLNDNLLYANATKTVEGDTTYFEWKYTVKGNAAIENLVFVYSGSGNDKFYKAKSQSVIVSPPLTYQVIVHQSIPENIDNLSNIAMIGDTLGLGFGIESNVVSNQILRPRLSIIKSASREGTLKLGEKFTYTLEVSNYGNGTAKGVIIQDILPSELQYVGMVEGSGQVLVPTVAGNTLTFNLGELKNNESIVIVFEVQVRPDLGVGVYTPQNSAKLNSTNHSEVWSNKVVHDITVAADFELLKTSNTSLAKKGETIEYHVDVINTGDISLTEINLIDPMIQLAEIKAEGNEFNEGDLNTNGKLDSGEIFSYTGNYTLSDENVFLNNTDHGTVLQNTVKGTSTQTGTTMKEASCEVLVLPEFEITKANTPLLSVVLRPGAEIEYTIRVKNVGLGQAQNLEIRDLIPQNTGFVPGSVNYTINDEPLVEPAANPNEEGLLTFTLDQFHPQDVLTYKFKVKTKDDLASGIYEVKNMASLQSDDMTSITSNEVMNIIKAATELRIKKTVTESTGYLLNIDSEQTFVIEVLEKSGIFKTSVVLKAGQEAVLEVPYGNYFIREVAIPKEYTLLPLQAPRVEDQGVEVTESIKNTDGTYDVIYDLVQFEFKNQFEHIPYFQSDDHKQNLFAPSP